MRVLAIVEYDGTDFDGFQVQKRGRTVQGELEKALHRITGEVIRVVGAGRTDSGVHAFGQGAHFDTMWSRSPAVLHRALNAVLPKDIAVHSLEPVEEGFSARYSARSRVYRYAILNQPVRSPLDQRHTLWVPDPLDAGAMNDAVQCLVGRHDFGAFGSPPRGDNTVREMLLARVDQVGSLIQVHLEANAFLYRMVRRIVGTLLAVGKGHMSPAEFRLVLEKKRRAGPSAPPQGLCLVAVKYDLG